MPPELVVDDPPGPRARVVLAEDNPDIRELIVIVLRRHEYEVEGYETGDEALTACLAAPPDLVLLDVSMPGTRDGLEVTRELRATPPTARVPVMLLTARAQGSDIRTGLAAGADAYLVKPFSPSELVARVADLTGRGL